MFVLILGIVCAVLLAGLLARSVTTRPDGRRGGAPWDAPSNDDRHQS